MTPWEFITYWSNILGGKVSDRQASRVNELMQERFPGDYRVVAIRDSDDFFICFEIRWDSPAAEAFFKLRYY